MMQCVAAGHQVVALANLRPAENTGMKATFFRGDFSFILKLEKMEVQLCLN